MERVDLRERRPDAEPRAVVAATARGHPAAALLLALQRTAGNRAVRQLVAREPGGDSADPPRVTDEEGARAERDIREFEETLGHPLSTEDREAMYRALSVPRTSETGHSLFTMALTGLQHPVKTAEHMGPKALIYDKLSEERYLLERFPNLFPELVRFFASANAPLTVNVQTLFEFQFEGRPFEAYNVYKYLQAKRGEGPTPRRVDVTPSMFGDAPQDIRERSLLLGPFNVIPERVHLPHEPGYEDGAQFKLRVTDTLGLGEGQQGIFYWMSFVVGSKDVVLAEYLGTIDASGEVEIKPWSARYEPDEPPKCDPSGVCFLR